jgi:hypothetical protein
MDMNENENDKMGDSFDPVDPIDPIDGRPGPARPISEQRAKELVRGAISRLLVADVNERAAPPVIARGRMLRVAIVVLGCLSAGVVVASLSGVRLWPAAVETEQRVLRRPASVLASPKAAPQLPLPESPAPAATLAEPERHEVRPTARLAAPVSRHRTVGKNVATDTAEVQQKVAEDALMAANRQRLQKQWRQAAHSYQEIMVAFAGSDTAYVAMVARGQLLLDHLDQPAEALSLFRLALAQRPHGPLTEETRYNIAVCYRRLGDVENEREALKLFLNGEQPNPLRTAAAARLAEIR